MPIRFERLAVPAALVAVAAVWGATFVVVADAIALYPMYAFLAWRFVLASVAFVLFFPRVLTRLDAPNVRMGLIAGVFLSAGYIFQTWGLDGPTATTPARGAFITGLYVVFVPLAQALILRRRPRGATLLGVGLALFGLWVLSGAGMGSGGWVRGDTLMVGGAVAYSAHMLIMGTTDARHDTGALTFVQLLTVALVTTSISLVTENASLPVEPSVLIAIAICGVLASAIAFVVQTWAQRRMQPARVALILVLEPAFGGLFGWAAAGLWPIREIMGALLMMGGMVTSEIVAAFRPNDDEHVEFEAAVEGIPVPLVEDDSEPVRLFPVPEAIDPREDPL